MMLDRRTAKGFTLVEMMVAMAVMGIVMTAAALEFKYVVYTHLFAESHLTAQQQARVAMARISGISRQASVVDDPNSSVSPPPAISEPAGTPGPRFVFTQVATLGPKMPIVGNVPAPCYNKVQLYLDKPAGEPAGKLYEQADPVDGTLAAGCDGFDYSNMPLLLARNVQDFQVEPIANIDRYATGYRVDLTIYDYEGHAIDGRAGAAYHLSTVIQPVVFGAAQ